MPEKDYTLTMARYNHWQNESMLTAADGLTDSERKRDRGAFFGSIEKTISHIYWADIMWLSRFAGTPPPSKSGAESTNMVDDWERFVGDRKSFDRRILQWAHEVTPDWFEGDIEWHSPSAGRTIAKSRKTLVIQFFNHQTHHRGQVHAMLTAAGAKPEETDLPFLPERFLAM